MKFNYKELINEISSRHFWWRFLIMFIGVLILAVTYNTLLLPNDFVIGGTSGIAVILNELLNIDPALIIFVIELFLLVISFIFLGGKQTGMTIIGSLLYPLLISVTEVPCAMLVEHLNFESNLVIALISGITFGVGSAFVYKHGFSTGGSDILMQILNKYLKITTGNGLFLANVIVIILGVFVFDINTAVYGIIVIYLNSLIVDRMLLGISNSKMFYIRTDKPEEVQDFIKAMNTGFTIIRAEGGISKHKKDLIMCVVTTKDYYMFKNIIQEIDPEAFFVISDCYEVYGGQRKEKTSLI